MKQVAIVGGGISGLSVAYALEALLVPELSDIVLFEASSELGGVIQSDTWQGQVLEGGPDTLTDRPFGVLDLVHVVGLDHRLIGVRPGVQGALVYGPDGWLKFSGQEARAYTLAGGLAELPHAVESHLMRTRILRQARVQKLSWDTRGRVRIWWERGVLTADAVILAVPAPIAADLMRLLDPERARRLEQILYQPRAVVTAVYPSHAFVDVRVYTHTGFMTIKGAPLACSGASWMTTKWNYPGARDHMVLRTFWGPPGVDPTPWSDHELIDRHEYDLTRALGPHQPPEFVRVFRHPYAVPQVPSGWTDSQPRVPYSSYIGMVGPFFAGAGLSDCVHRAWQEASRVTEWMTVSGTGIG